jgi:hypothetical protein
MHIVIILNTDVNGGSQVNERELKMMHQKTTEKVYRIYTEDKNREVIERLTSARFEGFTILSSVGHWQGTKENSLVIEILTDRRGLVYDLATEIKQANKQDAVLVISFDVNSILI